MVEAALRIPKKEGLLRRFTQWFNRAHSRTGRHWEDRFKSLIVEDGRATIFNHIADFLFSTTPDVTAISAWDFQGITLSRANRSALLESGSVRVTVSLPAAGWFLRTVRPGLLATAPTGTA